MGRVVLSAQPNEGQAPLQVAFEVRVEDADDRYRFAWDFGDGNHTGDARQTVHVFATPGRYRVRVTAHGRDHAMTSEVGILVLAPPFDLDINVDPDIGSAPLTVLLIAVVSGDPHTYRYRWDFGDGTAGEGRIVQHTYEEPGSYYATVIATASSGAVLTRDVAVQVEPPPAELEF